MERVFLSPPGGERNRFYALPAESYFPVNYRASLSLFFFSGSVEVENEAKIDNEERRPDTRLRCGLHENAVRNFHYSAFRGMINNYQLPFARGNEVRAFEAAQRSLETFITWRCGGFGRRKCLVSN
ncbi:hypothetical protein AVEN_177173-1 [Araneus ventricosus]|uniref:Uncharacterized protein n=1 Tax=Araneus ventricosus TaxID=182803 RepID=A0A4Y2V8Z4_ARAVE|nr:hypothetical protein AVEN_177173-1 [Araneus ventricosus]